MSDDEAQKRKDDWARWLGAQLAQRDLTPADVSRQTGNTISSSVMSRWLKGTYLPEIDKARALSNVLDITILEILIAAGQVTPEEVAVNVVEVDRDLDSFTNDELINAVRDRMTPDLPATKTGGRLLQTAARRRRSPDRRFPNLDDPGGHRP